MASLWMTMVWSSSGLESQWKPAFSQESTEWIKAASGYGDMAIHLLYCHQNTDTLIYHLGSSYKILPVYFFGQKVIKHSSENLFFNLDF